MHLSAVIVGPQPVKPRPHLYWLVVLTILILVNGKDYPIYIYILWKIQKCPKPPISIDHFPINHQVVISSGIPKISQAMFGDVHVFEDAAKTYLCILVLFAFPDNNIFKCWSPIDSHPVIGHFELGELGFKSKYCQLLSPPVSSPNSQTYCGWIEEILHHQFKGWLKPYK